MFKTPRAPKKRKRTTERYIFKDASWPKVKGEDGLIGMDLGLPRIHRKNPNDVVLNKDKPNIIIEKKEPLTLPLPLEKGFERWPIGKMTPDIQSFEEQSEEQDRHQLLAEKMERMVTSPRYYFYKQKQFHRWQMSHPDPLNHYLMLDLPRINIHHHTVWREERSLSNFSSPTPTTLSNSLRSVFSSS